MILNLTTNIPGLENVYPNLVFLNCDDSYETITEAGYLNNKTLVGNIIGPKSIILANYAGNEKVFLNTSIADNGIITLVPTVDSQVNLPVTDGDFAVFDGTDGILKDSGKSPSDAAKSKVVMLDAAPTTADNLAKFTDANGTAGDAGYKILSGTSTTFAGGGVVHSWGVEGIFATSKGSCSIRSSTNAVAIAKCVPTEFLITVTFTADPGAGTTVDYIYTNVAAVA